MPEPITNKLLISATPQYYPDIMRLIAELDAEPPQVVIQVLIAEVDLTSTEEFGVEIGLQSPVLFRRGIFPADGPARQRHGQLHEHRRHDHRAAGLHRPRRDGQQHHQPGVGARLQLQQPRVGLPQNIAVSPGVVGFQGLSSLGVGRVSPNNGIGGFVFSAGTDASTCWSGPCTPRAASTS